MGVVDTIPPQPSTPKQDILPKARDRLEQILSKIPKEQHTSVEVHTHSRSHSLAPSVSCSLSRSLSPTLYPSLAGPARVIEEAIVVRSDLAEQAVRVLGTPLSLRGRKGLPLRESSLLTTYWSGSTDVFWWTGLAPWEFEFLFPGSLISTFLGSPLSIEWRVGSYVLP